MPAKADTPVYTLPTQLISRLTEIEKKFNDSEQRK